MTLRPLAACAVAGVLVAGAAAAKEAVPPLRQCADPTNLPFSTNAPDAVAKGRPGLYVEVGQAIAKAVHRPLETVWTLSYFGKRNVRVTLLEGKCDFAVGLPSSDFMGPKVIFTRTILKVGYALVVPKKESVRGLDDLAGKKVAVQFSSPPQSLLATRDDVISVTVMDPEEGMRELAAGEVDAAFLWGPSAGWVNHVELKDAYRVIPVDAAGMQWDAAVGFAAKEKALRDQIDGVLPGLEGTIRKLAARYAVPTGAAIEVQAAAEAPLAPQPMLMHVAMKAGGPAKKAPSGKKPVATAKAAGDPEAGKKTFNGTCAHCHGPNAVVADKKIDLRRLKKKYGDQMDETFFTTVENGRPTKGMPAWKEVFRHDDFVNILAWLKTVATEE